MRSLQDVLVNDYGLDLTGWTLARAQGISDDGLVIAGYGTNPSGYTEGWVVYLGSGEPIPEPSTIILMTAGIAGIVAYGLWRRKKA